MYFSNDSSRCSPGLGLVIYLWFVVYAAYQVVLKLYLPLLIVILPKNISFQIVKKADTARRGAQVKIE